MKKLLLIIFLILTSFPVFATTRYVNPNGTCGGQSPCYTTIQGAANVVNAGDTVIVQNGTYTGGSTIVNLTRSGTSSNKITFKAENKWGAVIDGQNNTSNYCIDLGVANYINIEDFEIKGCGYGGVWSNDTAHDIRVYRNKIHAIADGVVVPYDPGGSVGRAGVFQGTSAHYHNYDSNVFYNIGRSPNTPPIYQDYGHDHGIYIRGDNSNITNNIFYDETAGYGIQVSPECNTITIINNTFVGPNPARDGGGIMMWNGTNVTVQNNIFASYTAYGVECGSYNTSNMTGYNNLSSNGVWANNCLDNTGFSRTGDLVSVTPSFLNPTTHDYHLQSNSYAINQGRYTGAPAYDYDNVARGNPPEIGAYEYGTGADTEAPTVPGSVSAQDTGTSSMTVTFTASTDNIAVTGYKVRRCTGVSCTPTTIIYTGLAGSPFNDSGLTANTTYCYTISAYDAANNESNESSVSCDATDALSDPINYAIIYGTSTTQTNCSDFASANAQTVGDYMTIKRMYNFTSYFVCVDSTDNDIKATCSRDGACDADDAFKEWISPTNNQGDPVSSDITLVISFNGEKKDSSVGLGVAKDIPMRSRVTTSGGHTYIWAQIPFSPYLYTSVPKGGDVWGLQVCEINGSPQTYIEKCNTKSTMTFGMPNVSYIKLGQ